jgi:DNA-binding transcriptional MerR regulator
MAEDLTRAQLGEALGLSVAAIRKYERLYGEHLMSAGGQKGVAKARTYPAEDVVLFALVNQLRHEGASLEAIHDLLPERLAAARDELAQGIARPVDYLPEVAQGQSVELAAWIAVTRQLEAVTGALEATENERDYLRAQNEQLQVELRDATARAAVAETERDLLAGRGVGFWARLFGGKGKG